MRSTDFAYWLQGFAELNSKPPTAEQWEIIKNHLNMVFLHELDATIPDPDGKLQDAHDGKKPGKKPKPDDKPVAVYPYHSPSDPLIRC